MSALQKIGWISLMAAILLSGCANTVVDDQKNAMVDVHFSDDVWRNDTRNAVFNDDASRRSAETALRKHLIERAGKVLRDGQVLDVTFLRIERAGSFEPWLGAGAQDVRIVRDIYPPRIDLTFQLSNAEGATLKAGNSQLRDPAFMMHTNMYPNDSLRFEKTLLDDWVRRDLSERK